MPLRPLLGADDDRERAAGGGPNAFFQSQALSYLGQIRAPRTAPIVKFFACLRRICRYLVGPVA